MNKKLTIAALALLTLVSCTDNEFVGETNTATNSAETNPISFGFNVQNSTRADIMGQEAAKLLGNNFYVMGTKGEEPNNSPTTTEVFDNYLVHYGMNTAGKTESNTSNWEYVGIDQGATSKLPEDYNRVKLSSINGAQTIKFWDYSVPQYDFLAFSTGTFDAVSKTAFSGTNVLGDNEIGVTKINTGATLATDAYTLYLPSKDALKNAFITDITTVEKTNYGNEVTLKFKNLGSKVRIALYETVPGYSVKDVVFYKKDGEKNFTDGDNDDTNDGDFKSSTAALISANTNGIPTKGTIQVSFPQIGSSNDTKQAYNKAVATVTAVGTEAANYEKAPTFGALTAQLVEKERDEATDDNVYLGRSLPKASFAGDKNAEFYETVFPVSDPSPLTLRVDYTLVPIDGAAEIIKVYGAKAVVPSTYTKWLPNYAYTYIFKISDNTNGWTDAAATKPGLFPITFDAVVTEATDATAEQTTITTVSTPSITTYQQGHTNGTDEYSKSTKGKDNVVRKLYVQVMHNEGSPEAHPVGSTYASCPHPLLIANTTSANTAFLYKVSKDDATEAMVMDALENRTTVIDADNVTGRNGITLTKNTNMNAVTKIVNGPDDNPITIASGHGNAAEIDIANDEVTTGTYAFVYDYTSGDKTTVSEYQPIDVTGETVGVSGKTYASITTTVLDGISATTAENEDVDNNFIYFSKTTNGTSTTKYSYVSVAGKSKLPKGLIKVAKTNTNFAKDVAGGSTAAANTFYFDTYITNNGKYAVKIIKIIA